MTTSPNAEAPAARRVKVMLPLRPDSPLLYSPAHSPVSTVISVDAPTSGTGLREAPQAERVNTSSGSSVKGRAMGRLAGRGLCVVRATAGALLVIKMVPLR